MYNILRKIQESYRILELEEDWDSDGALKADPKIFNEAMIFIHTLLSKVENICTPTINLCRDASIDFEFNHNQYGLLVNISDRGICCYGDNGNNEDVIKFNNGTVQDLAVWCVNHLTKS